MGQKSNSNILRLGINNTFWSSKYIEKISEESSIFIYQDLEIRSYINRFFNLNGLLIDKCFINRYGSQIVISISYFVLLDSLPEIYKLNTKLLKTNDFIKEDDKLILRSEKVLELKRLSYKNLYKKKSLYLSQVFLRKLTSCLNSFFNKNYKIKIIVQNINKGLSVRLTNLEAMEFRSIITQLRFYSKSKFFKESINLLLLLIKNQCSAKLFSEFISLKLSKMKRHNYFLTFLKRALLLMISLKFSSIKGIKIKIKGRFNGAPRAKSRLIQVGEIPLQTLKSTVSYHCSTSFTSNGTFGVQLWVS